MSTSETQRLVDLDLKHLWHPFTHHGLWGGPDEPVVVIERAEGNYLIDTGGQRYLDATSSIWCNTLGHRAKAVDDAIRAQLDLIAHSTMLGLSSKPAIELAAKLAELCPGDLNRVFFSDAGATAVELALKIGCQHAQLKHGAETKRRRFLTLDQAYHGDTMGSVSLGFTSWFHRHFAHLAFAVGKLPCPARVGRSEGESRESFDQRMIETARRQILEVGGELCAVIIEPLMQGAAGMIDQPPGFLNAIAGATKKAGGLLICDEVATGFWRTGTRFACEQEDVVPDILCVAKGLSAGYLPMAATVCRDHVFEPFSAGGADGAQTLFHGHTYTGNALGCAASLAGLSALEDLAKTGRIQEMADVLAELLAPLKDHPHVLEVRQRGLMAGVELVQDRDSKTHYPLKNRIPHQVAHHARRNGVMLRPLGPVLILMPTFSFSNDELTQTVAALTRAINAVCVHD